VPVYVIFSNRELAAIAAARPTTANGLLQLPGIGPGKVERYAEEVLRALGGAAAAAAPGGEAKP
jgi:superfamily II DNA helicase RecQ